MDDSDSLRAPVLGRHSNVSFRPLNTIFVVFCLILFMLGVEFVALGYVFVWTDSPIRCDLFYLLVYTEVTLWVINFIARSYISWKHKTCLMVKGYFEFHETSSRFIEIPFYISCIWLGVFVVILCLYIQYDMPHSFYCDTSSFYSPIIVVITTASLQNALLLPLFAVYIMKVYEFNKRQDPPESENDSQYMPNRLREFLAADDVGYRNRYEAVDVMLEKQADLIRYYKEANETLNKKVFELTNQCRSVLDPH